MRQVSKAIRQAVDKIKWDNRWTRSVSEQVNVVSQTTGGQGHAIGSWTRKFCSDSRETRSVREVESQTGRAQGQSDRRRTKPSAI